MFERIGRAIEIVYPLKSLASLNWLLRRIFVFRGGDGRIDTLRVLIGGSVIYWFRVF